MSSSSIPQAFAILHSAELAQARAFIAKGTLAVTGTHLVAFGWSLDENVRSVSTLRLRCHLWSGSGSRDGSPDFLVHSARFEHDDLATRRAKSNGAREAGDATTDNDNTKVGGRRDGHVR